MKSGNRARALSIVGAFFSLILVIPSVFIGAASTVAGKTHWADKVGSTLNSTNVDSTLSAYWLPSGHMTKNDVVLTSMRRDDVASTLIRRHFGECSLGMLFSLDMVGRRSSETLASGSSTDIGLR